MSQLPDDQGVDDEVQNLFAGISRRQSPSDPAAHRARNEARDVWQDLVAKRRRRQARRSLMAAAATVVIGMAVALLWQPLSAESWQVQVTAGSLTLSDERGLVLASATAPDAKVFDGTRAKADRPTRLILASGAEVRLSTGTQVRWQSPSSLALTQGSVYVDTHERSDFTVATPLAEITDVGTRYLVTLHEAGVSVGVRSGIALVRTNDRSYTTQPASGQAAITEVSATQEVQQYLEAASDSRWSWIHEAPSGYSSASVPAVLEAIANDLGQTLRYASPGDQAQLANTTYGGSLAGLAPYPALELIAGSSNLRWHEVAGELVIEANP